jgi:hypothetical protein
LSSLSYEYIFYEELKKKCQKLEDSIGESETKLRLKEAELAEARQKLTSGTSATSNKNESLLAEKEAEIMTLRNEVKTVSDDLKKAQALIVETRVNFTQVFFNFCFLICSILDSTGPLIVETRTRATELQKFIVCTVSIYIATFYALKLSSGGAKI